MSKYMIHYCENRQWYVFDYLVSSMIEQGIDRNNIMFWPDLIGNGCLKSFINSMHHISQNFSLEDGIWHLQDDVIISKDFKKQTELYDDGIVCGFCPSTRPEVKEGIVYGEDMWFSFPCMRMPNHVADSFIKWFDAFCVGNKQYRMWIKANKYNDTFFHIYVEDYYNNVPILNLSPNIVDHIDFLLGGSTINQGRKEPIRALYFEDIDLIDELEVKLNEEKINKD